jgi:hypothetical protein
MFETIRLAEKRIFAYNEFPFGCHKRCGAGRIARAWKRVEEVEPRAVLGSEGEFVALQNK